ncbi:PREDICTED: uncharacterized protein LOC106811872 [Priapulus caudatus]|uniref:Uncharacterized protein LOC106811872 n=1 Tax=Priapulus caudatus TaxID=37621 RepID=A0ABM1EFV9_PRICU|nr:PREDICTED: uncharacterized protein LOC106811872 [Priapulus caudatus]
MMMGGLHIEMALLKVLGDWLDGSGWTSVMSTANVTTDGRADALQKGSSTSRAQWAHQVTAAALFCLRNRGYIAYKDVAKAESMPVMSYDAWCRDMETAHPQFFYWSKVIKLEVLFLQFMRAQREGDFRMYVDTLARIVPWMFALDHYHYARWLSVHVRDLLQLEHECPEIWNEFMKGHFVTQKTTHRFSMMAHDHVHEQLNAVVKGDGGVIGITENESALRRWMIAGPEVARVIHELDLKNSSKAKHRDCHHEQTPSTQRRFATDVHSVVGVFEDMGNPFTETSADLIAMDTKVVMADEVIQSIRHAEEIGKAQYKAFVDERIMTTQKPFHDTITKNSFPMLKSGLRKTPSKSKSKTASMKSDLQLFSRMYISCQAREGDIDVFFEHENHAWPPSLADHNAMRQGNKADLLRCLEPLAPRPPTTPNVDVKIVDGAALVHLLEPKHAATIVKTFKDYAEYVFIPYLLRQLQASTRLDVVWDSYTTDSLKANTRTCRGTGDPLRVLKQTRIPQNWKSFLRVDSNKTELFKFLASAIEVTSTPTGKILVSTKGESVVSTSVLDVSDLEPCTHEEADYRMMLHCAHAFKHGLKKSCSIGKKTTWDVWRSLPNLTAVFIRLSDTPEEVTEADMEELENVTGYCQAAAFTPGLAGKALVNRRSRGKSQSNRNRARASD